MWFAARSWATIERIEENTTLSRYQQDKAIKILVSKGLLIYKTAGMPAKRYFKLSEEKLTNLFVKNSQTSLRKTNKQDCEKLTPNNKRENNNREIKIDNITPITPKRKSIKDINLDTLTELIGGYNFSQDIFSKLVEWYTYKAEQKKTITPTGMKTQLNKVNSMIASIGEDKVIYVLDESMANNYQGMIWDLANKGAKQSKKTNIEGWFEA